MATSYELSDSELRELMGYDAGPSSSPVSPDELAALGEAEQPRSSFLRRYAENMWRLPYELVDTAKGLAQGTFHVDPYKSRQMAENLGVRSAISKTVPIVDSVFDLSAGVAQKGAELVGATETAAEIEQSRIRSQQATDRLNQWNAEQDKQSIVGPKWAQRLRAADQSITESVGLGVAGGPRLATNVIADYYAVKGTQDYLKEHPDASPWWGGVHGFIEGAATKFFMDKFRPTEARLAGATEAQVAPIYSRAIARVKETIPYDKTVDALAGLGAEFAEEVTIYNGHYWADVLAGIESHDWKKYGEGLKETLIQTGLTAGAAEAGMGLANTFAKREAAMEKAIERELARVEQELDAEEAAMLTPEEQEAAKKKPAAKAPKEEVASVEQRMADVASRKRELQRKRVDESVARKKGTPGGEANPQPEVEPANTDERWKRVPEMEREIARAREELKGKLTPKRKRQLQSQVADMSAKLAEEVTALLGEEGGPQSFEADTPIVLTRAQRRVLSLQKKLDAANARTKALKHRQRKNETLRREMVDEAFEILVENVPPLDRKHLPKRAAGIKTPEQFNKFLDAVNDTLSQRGKRLADKRVTIAMKSAQRAVKKSTAAQKALNDVTKNVDLGSKASRNQLAGLKDYMNRHPEKEMPAWYADAISRLDTKHKSELTTDDLNQLADAIEAVMTTANNDALARDAFQEQTADAFATQIVGEVEASEPLRRSLLGNIIGEAGWKAANVAVRPENIMASVSEGLRQLAWENIGVKAMRDYLHKAREPVRRMSKLLDSLGLSPAFSYGSTIKGSRSPLNAWRHAVKSIGGVVMTRAEALHMAGLLTDPHAAARLRNVGANLGRARSIGRKAVTTHINFDDGTVREILDFIGPEGQQIVEHAAREINTTMRDWVDTAWVERYGHEISQGRTDYFPMKIDTDYIDPKGGDPFARFQDFVLESFSILQERDEAATAPLEIRDFFNVYGRHADTVARVSAYLNPAADFLAVYKRPEVKAAIENATSPVVYEGMLEAVNQQILPVTDKDFLSRAARRLVRGSGAAILGLRKTTPYMAATSAVTATQYLPNGEKLAAQAAAQMANPAAVNDLESRLQQTSPYWDHRFNDLIGEHTGGLAGVTQYFDPGDALSHLAMYHITTADKFSSLFKAFMAEAHVEQNRGIPRSDPRFNDEVALEWERLMYRTESTSNGLEATGGIRAGRRHGVAAALFQFESGASKDRSLLMKAGQDVRDGRAKAGAKAAAAWASNQLWIATIGLIFAALRGKGKDETIASRAAQEAIGQLPGSFGEIASGMYRRAVGLAAWDGPVTSLGEVLAETTKAGFSTSEAIYAAMAGEFDDEGHPAYKSHIQAVMKEMVPLVQSVTKLPIESAIDSGGLALNLAGIEGDDAFSDKLRGAVRELWAAQDIKSARGKLRRAIEDGDDELFLAALAEIAQKNPERLTEATLKSVIDGQFTEIRDVERILAERPDMELSPAYEAKIMAILEQRERLYQTAAEMVQRNYGQIIELVPASP